ncbi:MAG: UDP-N-acetylglucosamine 2-epimerase [Candidatus Woesearchaeota archaeon]|nr:UDP-N-acetylglucosamine 2-epimerase [Candidatus Woesearchaeota archaeon]
MEKKERAKRIVYVTGTRADYGLMRPTLKLIENGKMLDLKIIATGMHLMPEFGSTIEQIKKDGFDIEVVDSVFRKDSKDSMAEFAADFMKGVVKKLEDIRPDVIILLGDRAEMLVSAVAALYLNIPTVHIHGGEVSRTVDEVSRHAITKLSSFHIAATKKSAERIKKMGEENWRIHLFGAPGLDDIKDIVHDRKEAAKMFGLDLRKQIAVVVQHPENPDVQRCEREMKETMKAVDELGKSGYQIVMSYPNADAGGRAIISVIEQYRNREFIKIYRSIPRDDFLNLLSIANVMIGNSSSGIIEAPFFRLPAVNVGNRQEGREKTVNVIDASYSKDEILKAVRKADSADFRKRLKSCKSPYGDGNASKRIVNFLLKTEFGQDKVLKSISY